MTARASSLDDLGSFFGKGGSLFLSGCAAEIPGFVDAGLLCQTAEPTNVSGIFLPGVNGQDYTALGGNVSWQTYFMSPGLAKDPARENYCPWRYRDILAHYQATFYDIAVVMLSEPSEDGYCSYGVCADFAPEVLPRAKIKIGVINKQMPFTLGVKGPHLSELDAVVEIDLPLIEVPASQSVDEVSAAIAKNVASFIGDGATLQLGLGKIPATVVAELADRKNLKLISGLLDEAMLGLEDSGALTTESPALVGVALGSKAFYQRLHKNERYSFQPVSLTHNVSALSAVPDLITVNGALEVDLFGQVNSCVTPKGFLSGPGGLPEFAAGALNSKGGRSIIALPATAGKKRFSKIVPQLQGAMPSISAIDADTVVTEYGAAELRGKSIAQRVAAMISIAAPEHRDELQTQAGRFFKG